VSFAKGLLIVALKAEKAIFFRDGLSLLHFRLQQGGAEIVAVNVDVKGCASHGSGQASNVDIQRLCGQSSSLCGR